MGIYNDFTEEELAMLEREGVITREELEYCKHTSPEEYYEIVNEFNKMRGKIVCDIPYREVSDDSEFEDEDYFDNLKSQKGYTYQNNYGQRSNFEYDSHNYSQRRDYNYGQRNNDNTFNQNTSSGPVLDRIQEELEEIGYFPNKQITIETQLNINKIMKSKVGQKVHAFCLSGPPGAGKSFYVESYAKLVKKKVNKPIKIISYQCHTKTSDSNLYEDINIAAAINGDSDKVVIPGKLVQAIDLANDGNVAILFLDEYDKAGEEVDTFLLNFLQEGVVDTTQRGKVFLKEECMKNLQVFLCKNDQRESLSGPLTRRLKFLELDYMTPENLCKIVNRKLEHIDSGLRDAVILIYTAMYETLPEHSKNGEEVKFEFSRLPAASECMQAIEDAHELMEIGANKADIIFNGVVANMIKTKDDLEQFKMLTKSNSQLVEWYNRLMEALGTKDSDFIEKVKQQMAREFFPEQIRRATKEIEEEGRRRKAQLESQYEAQQQELQIKINKVKRELEEYDKKLEILNQKEKDIERREKNVDAQSKEVQRLRDTAESDAKKVVDQYLEMEKNKLDKEYKQKSDELEKLRKETEDLRANADADALKKAKEELKDDREKLEIEIKEKKQELIELLYVRKTEINRQVEEVNNQIRVNNLKTINSQEKQETIEIYEQELQECKKLLKKLLGRPVTEKDFVTENKQDETILVGDNGKFETVSDESQEIQENNIFNKEGSVFENSNNGMWIDIGEIILENTINRKMIFDNNFLRKLIETYEKKGIYKDGIVIYKGSKITIIAVRVLEKNDEKSNYSNKFKFYANTTVLPKYSLLDVCNFINYITPGGKYISDSIEINGKTKRLVFSKPIGMKLNCMIYSEEKYPESQNSNISKIEDNEYLLSFENIKHTQFPKIAEDIFNITNCSRKDIPFEVLNKNEQEALILHNKNIGVEGLINKIVDIEDIEI